MSAGPRFQRAGGLAELEDPTRVLFERTLAAIERDEPELARIVRLCVIPRRLDPAIVGVLSERTADDVRNLEVMDVLAGLELVEASPDAALAFRDSVRDRLLRDWRSDEGEWGATFEAVNDALVDHHAMQYEAAVTLARDLGATAHVVRPERYALLSRVVEAKLREPLLEALYHEMLRSPDAGMSFFERAYTGNEQEMRFGVCAALLGEAQVQVASLYSDDEAAQQLRWLPYWEARLARSLYQLDESEEILRDVVSNSGGDAKLQLWAGGELGAVLQQQFELREALAVYLDNAAHADETEVDPWNTAVTYICLGSLYRVLRDVPKAIAALEKAVGLAEEVGNEAAQALALVNLGEARWAAGQQEAAFDAALRAFDLARTSQRDDRQLQGTVGDTFMALVGGLEPQLLDTVWREARGLAATMGDPLVQLEVDNRYADVLRESGRFSAGEQVLDLLELRAREYGNPNFSDDVSLTRALLEERRGDLSGAIDVYGRFSESTAWSRAAKLSNRTHIAIQRLALDEAADHLGAARTAWEEIGCEALGGLMQVWEADIAFRRGDAAGAHAALDDAESTLEAFASGYLADCFGVRARVLSGEGRWVEAIERQRLALALQERYADLRGQGDSLTDLASMTARIGDHPESARWARAATEHFENLVARNTYAPADQADDADDQNVRGMLRFFTGGYDHESCVQARDHLRAAVANAPENFWYQLNLAYVCASMEEWAEAANSIEAALRCGPEPIAASVVHERLAEWRMREGLRLHDEESHADAVLVFDAAFAGLGDSVSRAQLADFARGAGDSLLKQGLTGAAKERYDRGAALLDDEPARRVAFVARLGIIEAASGDPAAAAERFAESLSLAGDPADGFWHIVKLSADLTYAAAKPLVADALRTAMRNPEIGGRVTRFSPTITVPMPPDWSAKESLTLVAPDGQANLVASSEPVPDDLSSRDYADALGALLTGDEFPGYRERSFERIELADGREAWLRRFDWDPPESPSVSQAQLYYVDGARGYTATATTPVTEAERYDIALTQLLEGIRLR